MNRKDENKWSAFFVSRWFLAVVFLAICFVGFAILRSYLQEYQIKEEVSRLKEEALQLETKRIETLEILKYVQSPQFAEEKARTEFNMQKEGEHLVIVKNSPEIGVSGGQDTGIVLKSNMFSNPFKWWNLFTGK